MNLQALRYFVALAEHRHFGRAARACNVSQPSLSGQIRKLEEHLGVLLFERTNRWVALTPAGQAVLEHARKALDEVELAESVARSAGDQLTGSLKLGVIPTLAPYLIPRILGPLREDCPQMSIEIWEDFTVALLDRLRAKRLDAALIATDVSGGDVSAIPLFVEPFLAALPPGHRLAGQAAVLESDLAVDLLVLTDGHCLAAQSIQACGQADGQRDSFQAASLDTLLNLVAAGYGTTLIPALAAEAFEGRNLVFRPLMNGTSRTIRLAARPSFPRPRALRALERTIRKVMG